MVVYKSMGLAYDNGRLYGRPKRLYFKERRKFEYPLRIHGTGIFTYMKTKGR